MDDVTINWEKIYSHALGVNTIGYLTMMIGMMVNGDPILADKWKQPEIQELMDKGLVLKSGNSLRVAREIFKFT